MKKYEKTGKSVNERIFTSSVFRVTKDNKKSFPQNTTCGCALIPCGAHKMSYQYREIFVSPVNTCKMKKTDFI